MLSMNPNITMEIINWLTEKKGRRINLNVLTHNIVIITLVISQCEGVVNIENNYPTNFGNHEEQRHCE